MNPLFTDLYQITMAYAEWKAKRADEKSVFEAFFRKAPFKGNYTIFAGLDEVCRFLKDFKFTADHLAYIKSQLPHVEDEFLAWLEGLNPSQDVKVTGMLDGTIVYASEPLLTLEGPFALLQLLETPILNLINFASLVCTNASRMVLVSGDNVKCVEFGLRRAQGPNGSLTASKYSYLGGFAATSNVYAGYLYGIPIAGTCAHSFIMSFESEDDIADSRMLGPKDSSSEPIDILERAMHYREELGWQETQLKELYAFVSFAVAYPNSFSSLVDSYSTLNSGVKNFLLICLVLTDLGYTPIGIRLDSGDLADLSIQAKKMFAEVGTKYGRDFSNLKVVASNDINEKAINQLNEKGHQIDMFGIGTNLVTCQAQPALGMVYKVVEFKGTPRVKISEEPSKTTIGGAKAVLRAFDADSKPVLDLMCLMAEYESLSQASTEEVIAAVADPKTADLTKIAKF